MLSAGMGLSFKMCSSVFNVVTELLGVVTTGKKGKKDLEHSEVGLSGEQVVQVVMCVAESVCSYSPLLQREKSRMGRPNTSISDGNVTGVIITEH